MHKNHFCCCSGRGFVCRVHLRRLVDFVWKLLRCLILELLDFYCEQVSVLGKFFVFTKNTHGFCWCLSLNDRLVQLLKGTGSHHLDSVEIQTYVWLLQPQCLGACEARARRVWRGELSVNRAELLRLPSDRPSTIVCPPLTSWFPRYSDAESSSVCEQLLGFKV